MNHLFMGSKTIILYNLLWYNLTKKLSIGQPIGTTRVAGFN